MRRAHQHPIVSVCGLARAPPLPEAAAIMLGGDGNGSQEPGGDRARARCGADLAVRLHGIRAPAPAKRCRPRRTAPESFAVSWDPQRAELGSSALLSWPGDRPSRDQPSGSLLLEEDHRGLPTSLWRAPTSARAEDVRIQALSGSPTVSRARTTLRRPRVTNLGPP
jgi:hypothetical protein